MANIVLYVSGTAGTQKRIVRRIHDLGEGYGYRQMNNRDFVAELRRHLGLRHGGMSNVVVGLTLDYF